MKLTVCAITFNEAEHLVEWYNLHKDLADEIFIVDTGSYDDTLRVAKDLGLRVEKIKWKHDFADAKNKAIRYSKGDWILLQNPDLWIHPENFEALRKSLYNKKAKGYALPCIGDKKFCNFDIPMSKDVPRDKIWAETHLCLFRNDPKIEYRHRVHENAHESIVENYGENAIEILPIVRGHHTPDKVYFNKGKLRYYWCLEDYGAIERKFWEHAEHLKKQAYDAEL